jgi:hypothetical protein
MHNLHRGREPILSRYVGETPRRNR